MLVITITFMFIAVLVGAQQDPYLIYGRAYKNDKPITELPVIVYLYNSEGELKSIHNTETSKSGFYNIVIDNYEEGNVYTVKTEGFIQDGRIILYDTEGYQRMGDEINININITADNTIMSTPYFVHPIIPIVIILSIYIIYRKKILPKKREEK